MVYILWFCLVGVEIEMKHRVPTFSIPTQCNREVQVCVPYLFFTLFLRVRDVWFRRCLSDIRAQTSGGNSDWKLCGVVPCSWCGISCVILLRLCCWIVVSNGFGGSPVVAGTAWGLSPWVSMSLWSWLKLSSAADAVGCGTRWGWWPVGVGCIGVCGNEWSSCDGGDGWKAVICWSGGSGVGTLVASGVCNRARCFVVE